MWARVGINASHVVHETIDGEAILIHLGTGTYYSLDGVSAEVWNAVAGGAERESLLAAAAARYDDEPAEVGAGLLRLVDELLEQELLVELDAELEPVKLGEGRVPFEAPVLHTYTDMQEFMLVDPLHEVDEATGWPNVRAG